MDIVNKINAAAPPDRFGKRVYMDSDVKPGSQLSTGEGGVTAARESEKPFDQMNNLVANLLLNLTR